MSPRLTVWMAQASGSMIAASSASAHRVRHAAIRDLPLEGVDVVDLAHPILAAGARAAVPTRHDLLGDHTFAKRELAGMAERALAHFSDHAEEFMAGNDRRLHPRLVAQNIFAPEWHLQSLAQLPQAVTLMTHSPGPASGRSTCSTR